MTVQRRRGFPIVIYPRVLRETARGDKQYVVDEDNPIRTRGWMSADRSTKAEVPGQQEVDVIKIGIDRYARHNGQRIDLDKAGLAIGARVELMDEAYDVAQPPAYRHGSTRHVRHLSVTLRRRPSDA